MGRSLSARRAWIEILTDDVSTGGRIKVALRKESVDRNIELSPWGGWGAWSLSARRAWIEMTRMTQTTYGASGRSPQGERG